MHAQSIMGFREKSDTEFTTTRLLPLNPLPTDFGNWKNNT